MKVDELRDRLEGLLDVRPADPRTLGGIERRARRRRMAARARRIGLSVGVVCVIAGGIAVLVVPSSHGSGVVVRDSGSNPTSKAPPATQVAPAPLSLEDVVGPECKASALADPTATFRVFDRGLHTPVDFPLRVWCDEVAQLTPAPGGDLHATFTLTHAKVTASYYLARREIVRHADGTTSEIVHVDGPLSTTDARRRLAAQHRRWVR
ncbi:MAG: hypothetical protein QOE62_2568 [Actinomycetota bacterium]|nr:hypothetical protein [Actinomycetota bacterium]